jgi:hypothetical protein
MPLSVSEETKCLLGSWLRAFVAGSVALAMGGNYEPNDVLKAGLAAVLPVIYNWANPKDTRYGRH